jgi:hypothetical protein
MPIVRRLSYLLCANLLRLCLIFFPLLTAGVVLFGTSSHLKTAIQDSGIYNNFVGAVLDKSVKTSNDPSSAKLLADKGIQEVAKQTFTPGVLQQKSEQFIDSTYNWMDGTSPHLAVNINLTEERQALLTNLAAYGQQRASQLPACTVEQLGQVQGNQDILTIPCLPPGINIQQASQQFSADVVNSAGFLKDPALKSDDLLAEGDAKANQQLKQIPKVFQLFTLSPWLAGILLVLLTSALLFLNPSRRSAIRSIAWMLIITGGFLLVAIAVYTFLFSKIGHTASGVDAVLQNATAIAIASLVHDFNIVVLVISAAYVTVGAGVLLTLRRWDKPMTTTTPVILADPPHPQPVPDTTTKKPEENS